ncbi:MAG: InlB B-repeat-containing protein, partial [Nitrososphaeria archaeon]
LPYSITVPYGTQVSFSYQSPLLYSTGIQYVWTSTSGLSSSQSATITATQSGSITGNYQLQYYLTMEANPSGAGSVSPNSGWYNAGAQVTISAVPNAGYRFSGWVGIGSGSYSGIGDPTVITMNAPITEIANFNPISRSAHELIFSATGLNANAQGTVVTVNGVSYSYSQLPVTFYLAPGSTVSYSFNSPLSGGSGTQFVWQSTSGVDTAQSGSFTMPNSPASLVGNYQ